MNDGIVIIKDERIGFRLNSQLKGALRQLAKEEGTSLSGLIHQLVLKELNKKVSEKCVTSPIR